MGDCDENTLLLKNVTNPSHANKAEAGLFYIKLLISGSRYRNSYSFLHVPYKVESQPF